MAFRLRTIERTVDGRQIVRDRDIDGAQITLGRAAENDIHLPDLAVDPAHATITATDGGLLSVEAVGTLGFAVDGKIVRKAEIDSRAGAELRFGTYRLTVSLDADGTPLLTIERVAADRVKTIASSAIAGIIPGKRAMSWALVLLILGIFLALPIASNLTRGDKTQQSVIGDRSWSPGKLSLAHHALETRCVACHVKPFEAVRDTACLSCHKDIGDHAEPGRLSASRGNGSLGDRALWAVAHSFGKPGPGACTDCHTEHQGMTRMAAPVQQFCADCHGALDRRLADTTLGNAADFGRLHPQFMPAIVTDPISRQRTAISLDEHPRERNGLTFPHRSHLDPLGGVARMAASFGGERGYGRTGLQCKDCHHPSEDRVRFQPINMERDCEGCHSLAYDRVGGIFRRLRHGDVPQMIADLSVAGPSQPIVTGRKRPGDYAEGKPYHFTFSNPAFNGLRIGGALSPGGICGECHTATVQKGKLAVTPVTLVSRYMRNGWFDHKAHAQQKCTSCHGAETSISSSDLLLPDIGTCRTCHLGEDATKAKVPSGCAMCHSYHPSVRTRGNLKSDRS